MFLKLFLFILLKIIADYSYIHMVSPMYEYAGAILDISITKTAISYIILVLLSSFVSFKDRKPSDFGLAILLVLVIIPILSMWGLQNQDWPFACMASASFMGTSLIVKSKIRGLWLPRIRNGRNIYLVTILMLICILVLWIIVNGGLSFFSLDFSKFYEYRDKAAASFLTGPWAYLWNWSAKSFLVVLMALSLWQRKRSIFLFAVCAEIFFVAVTAHKGFIFYTLMVIFVYVCHRQKILPSRALVVCVAALITFSALVSVVLGNNFFVGLIAYRALDVVGINHWLYYNFFQFHPHVYFSNSFMSFLVDYPYAKPVPAIIGAGRYEDGVIAFSNVGYIGSAYMQAGAFGIFLYTCALGVILKMADILVMGKMPLWVGRAVVASSVFPLVNTDLTTSLLTSGIGVSLIALWLIGTRTYNQDCDQLLVNDSRTSHIN